VSLRIMLVALRHEQDVVTARQRARQISGLLGFEAQDQVRIATAVSEIARNAFRYAGGGEVEFSLEGERSPQVLEINVRDSGKGIDNLDTILSGGYRSSTGMGLGIIGARRLMDHCTVRTSPQGTRVDMKKLLPEGTPQVGRAELGKLARSLASGPAVSALDEVQQQNRELIRTLEELRERQEELSSLNNELEDTNRGVVALYAELEERADFLRRADETKTRFLSNMSHEFRTPLNSMRALTRLLLDRSDGPLTPEQEIQLNFIAKATSDLAQLVDDLLDLAKIEAGKVDVRPADFVVEELFSALRGMLRPLLVSDKVLLHFDAAEDLPILCTDEGKVSQILRNLISNALKFTERGEIRVTAELADEGASIVFAVADTGIGIPEDEQERVFEEFTQVRGPHQTRVKGTGLGLPLCRRLASLLGGSISLRSVPGQGSTFTVTLPLRHQAAPVEAPLSEATPVADERGLPILVVEDQADVQLYYQKLLVGSAWRPVQARTVRQAQELLIRLQPSAILMDIKLGHESTWRWLSEVKQSPVHGDIPVIVATSVDDPRKGYALGADAYIEKPVGQDELLETLARLARARVLVIDDDPAARYAIRKLCGSCDFFEAGDAREGLAAAGSVRPELIVLDLNLPDRRGEDVLLDLAAGASTRSVPIVIATSEKLSAAERGRLEEHAQAVLSKEDFDRDTFAALLKSIRPRGRAIAAP
jgi:signal transduction histidine kinase/CheY-like chemotaxis protein